MRVAGSLKIVSARERPDLAERAAERADDVWPEYNRHGDVLNEYWGNLDEVFPDFQFVLYDEETDEVVAQGHSIPCAWDGTVAGLPEGIDGMIEYVSPKVDERAESPADDFISVLAQAENEGVFTRHQVLVNTALLLFAGHETTMNLICNGALAFIRHPEQWERLRADPAGAARVATEECLRYDPPVKSTQRIAAEDVERHGKTIRKGDRLRWIMAAANRDPRAFADPDRFDIARQPNPHVSFGAGIHYCLGASLARIEGQEVFCALAERFGSLRLETDELSYQPSIQFRSLASLPVAWD